jgi:hypothetical protein
MILGLALAFVLDIKDPNGGTFLLPLTAAQLLWIKCRRRRAAGACLGL